MENGNLERFFSSLDHRLSRIEASIDRLAENHQDHKDATTSRIAALELKNAEESGGTKMLIMLGTASATLGGLVASFIGKIWPT